MNHPFHPAAGAFPLLPEIELANLADDIRMRGVRVPIVRYKGLIIDGRNRYLACLRLGITPPEVEWDGSEEDLEAEIDSLNEHRRHLTPEFRSKRKQDRILRAAKMSADGATQGEIAEQLGVSQRQVSRDLDEAVKTGVLTESRTTTGKDGKKYPAKKKRTPTQNAAAEAKAKLAAARQREPGEDDEPAKGRAPRNGAPVGPSDVDGPDEPPAPKGKREPTEADKAVAALGVVSRFLDAHKLYQKHEKAIAAIKTDIWSAGGKRG